MMRAAAVLAAVLVIAAPGMAGDEANPEIDDPDGDAGAGNAWGDLTIGWLNDTAADVVTTLMVADIPPVVPQGYVYYVVFDIGTGANATFGCFAFFDSGAWAFGCAHWDRATGPQDDLEGSGSVAPGMPGTVVLNLPRSLVANATVGTVVGGISAGSGTAAFVPVPLPLPVAPGRFLPDDAAEASRDYVLASGPPAQPGGPGTQGPGNTTGNTTGNNTEPPAQQPARTPGLEVPATVAAVGLLARAARRRR